MALDQAHRIGGHRRSRFSTPSGRRRLRVGIVVGLFLGFVGLAWAWAFQRGPSDAGSDVPLLVADRQPTREKPADEGGMKVPDIDPLSYDAGRSPPRVESILPAPEKPLPQPAPEQHAAVAPAAPSDVAPTVTATPSPANPVQVAENPAGPPVKLVPDVEPPPVKPVAAMTPMPTPTVRPQPQPKPAVALEEPKPKPVAISPGGYRLQLASLKSSADARATEERLRRTYGDLLGSVAFSVVSVNLGDRGTYYRVMAGPMSQGSASQLCDALRQRGAACILAKS